MSGRCYPNSPKSAGAKPLWTSASFEFGQHSLKGVSIDWGAELIKPTPKANRLREEIVAALHAHFAPINAALTEREQATLLSLLRKLRTHLEDRPQQEQR